MTNESITFEASVHHTLLERRSVLTIVLHGGDREEREVAAQAILAQVAPQHPPSAVARPPPLTAVFSLLANPPVPHVAESVPEAVQSAAMVLTDPAPISPYDESFILAPLG